MPMRTAGASPADPKRALGFGGQGLDLEPGPDGSLGVVFMCVRITEIHHDAVAAVMGDETVVTLHHAGAASPIGRDDVTHILGVDPLGQCRRAHHVTEHDVSCRRSAGTDALGGPASEGTAPAKPASEGGSMRDARARKSLLRSPRAARVPRDPPRSDHEECRDQPGFARISPWYWPRPMPSSQFFASPSIPTLASSSGIGLAVTPCDELRLKQIDR